MKVEEHSRFQLEATKLGRNVVFQVTVFRRVDSKNKKLFAETQCSDPVHYIIQFVLRDAADIDGILNKFRAQLLHRGFTPLRYRLRDGQIWHEWQGIMLTDDEQGQLHSRG